jgi:hypothetical protein
MPNFEFIGSVVVASLLNYFSCGTFSKENTIEVNLLNQTTSLSCNHVCCSSFIVLSLNHNSSCHVCKIIVGSREELPTPHMDVLVNIYKKMKVETGINLFNSKLIVQSNGTKNANKEN